MERRAAAPERPRPPAEARAARCANCDIEIEGDLVEKDEGAYCCEGCAIGGPCVC